ncbi:hypothetical protein PINS_up004896 [Pythium insidiosum]|nr:hypothetical protein PINS_up004896 [Pythium insidiosum]
MSSGLHEQKENATFRGQRLAAVPSDLLTMRNLVLIDLSANELTRFPGQLVAAEMLRLEVLHLQSNLLFVLEDILALSRAPRLRELNVLQNPLRLLDNRVYLLEALFFGASGCDEKQLRMVHKDSDLRTHAGLEPGDVPGIADATPNMSKRLGHHRHLVRSRSRGRHGHGPQHTTMRYVARLPRRCGFPMLQRLNGAWITDADVHAVEQERGRAVEYYLRDGHTASAARRTPSTLAPSKQASTDSDSRRSDGSRMTILEMLRRDARSTAVPSATVIHRFQIDVESADVIEEPPDVERASHDAPVAVAADDSNPESSSSSDGAGAAAASVDVIAAPPEQCDVIHRLFGRARRSASTLSPSPSPSRPARASQGAVDSLVEPVADDSEAAPSDPHENHEAAEEDGEPWSFPIATFDELSSDDRQYVRQRSKQTVTSILRRDDEFFASSVFLDCVAQAERSRRLTQHAVDALCPRSEQPEQPASLAAARLRETMETSFSREADEQHFAKLQAFRQSMASLRDRAMVLGDVLASDHAEQRQRTTRLLQQSHSEDVLGLNGSSSSSSGKRNARVVTSPEDDLATVARSLDDSLSRTKLRNAVDLANVLSDKKQEKRVLQLLLDADAKVIEEERVALEQALHRHRLDLIATNQFYGRGSTLDADRDWMRRAQRQSKITVRHHERAPERERERERKRFLGCADLVDVCSRRPGRSATGAPRRSRRSRRAAFDADQRLRPRATDWRSRLGSAPSRRWKRRRRTHCRTSTRTICSCAAPRYGNTPRATSQDSPRTETSSSSTRPSGRPCGRTRSTSCGGTCGGSCTKAPRRSRSAARSSSTRPCSVSDAPARAARSAVSRAWRQAGRRTRLQTRAPSRRTSDRQRHRLWQRHHRSALGAERGRRTRVVRNALGE